jgi:hypothetical protein
MNIWLRFPNVNIPRRSIITSAYITMVVQSKVGAGGAANIYAEDAVSPSYPTSLNDYNSRITTASYVLWEVSASTGRVNSPSLTAVIQEIVNNYNCGSIQFLIKGVGSGQNFTGFRAVDFYPTDAARFNVEYSPPTGGTGWLIGGPGKHPLISGPGKHPLVSCGGNALIG